MYTYARHQSESTLLYQIVDKYYPMFESCLAAEGRSLPSYVQQEFTEYLKCGRLEYGFLRVRCEKCTHERLVAFSCKRRGFCPSCGARRMIDSAALLVDTILPRLPMRQWVLSFPFHLRLLFARQPLIMSKVLAIVYRALATYLIKKAGFSHKTARTGAVTLIQRFGSALNLNIHFHMLFLDGVYLDTGNDKCRQRFQFVKSPTVIEMRQLTKKISLRIARYLERAKLIERDAENYYLAEGALGNNEMTTHQGHRAEIVNTTDDKKQHREEVKPEAEKQVRMTWAQRLKRVFDIDIKVCAFCSGVVKIIACIEDQAVINKILSHLQLVHQNNQVSLPMNHAPPALMM